MYYTPRRFLTQTFYTPNMSNTHTVESMQKVPQVPKYLYRLLEQVYKELSLRYNGTEYGFPVHAGGRHIWGQEGLYEELKRHLKQLTWEEYKQLLDNLRKDPTYYGKIYVTFHMAPNGRVEPHDIIFYRPVFTKRW